ncbi:diaminohydroxyphosphoribosylaminopyrimidine deaminase [Paenibacillus sp. JCM 10914]|nr:diaminohydroxyphosphoribosylaminopyrimidine deaminase [Paenibacillus sp. JCM 10914]
MQSLCITPPCSERLIADGVKRVVIACEDPNPLVAGRGVAMLRAAGIEVETGILRERALRLNEAFIKYITTGRPFVTLKNASTLDGRSVREPATVAGYRMRNPGHTSIRFAIAIKRSW